MGFGYSLLTALIIVLFTGLIFIGGGMLIYLAIYRIVINHQLKVETPSQKRMLAPRWAAVILLIIHLIGNIPTLYTPFGLLAQRNERIKTEQLYIEDSGIYSDRITKAYLQNAVTLNDPYFVYDKVHSGIRITDSMVRWREKGYYYQVTLSLHEEFPEDAVYEVTMESYFEEGQGEGGTITKTFTAKDFPVSVVCPYWTMDYPRYAEITFTVRDADGKKLSSGWYELTMKNISQY